MHVKTRTPWEIPYSRITNKRVYLRRRELLAGMAGAVGSAIACAKPAGKSPLPGKLKARRNDALSVREALTTEDNVFHYNNFYEFTLSKEGVYRKVSKFRTKPWTLKVGGACRKPAELHVEELLKRFTLEERVYRHRCVEAWAMVVPWIGFPLKSLLHLVDPLPKARFVRFVSFLKPKEAPGQRSRSYPWPYHEALRLDEAMHPLAMVVLGLYGRLLRKQNGAPVRIVCPWKYGYKSPKSIVKIELTEKRPATFWNSLAPDEYSFLSNVDPAVPHPRWSQARERLIDTGAVVATRPFNGYGDQVAKLYK